MYCLEGCLSCHDKEIKKIQWTKLRKFISSTENHAGKGNPKLIQQFHHSHCMASDPWSKTAGLFLPPALLRITDI